jgi:hypothetical protein
MPIGEAYRKQAALLIKTVSFVATEEAFALKGVTTTRDARARNR